MQEELSWWHNVRLHNLGIFLGIPAARTIQEAEHPVLIDMIMERLLVHGGPVVWLRFGHHYDPFVNELATWDKWNSTPELLALLSKAREKFQGLLAKISTSPAGCIKIQESVPLLAANSADSTTLPVLFGCSKPASLQITEPLQVLATSNGLVPVSSSSKTGCYLDLSVDAAENNLLVADFASIDLPLPRDQRRRYAPTTMPSRKRIAVGFPTTSRGMAKHQTPIFLSYILPSLVRTLTSEELRTAEITIYIGIDNGDPLLNVPEQRRRMLESTKTHIANLPIAVKFILLPNVRRVAQLWNLLFLRAMRDGHDYFYQVNDDLTLLTPGWLTYFVSTLDRQGGFGVVGPADSHNDFNCTLLTQAMVGRVHYEIFGFLYPHEIKDWHSDTWLTQLYQPHHTHCRPDMLASNGGMETRYQHCLAFAFSIYLAEGRRRIAQWKSSHSSSHPL